MNTVEGLINVYDLFTTSKISFAIIEKKKKKVNLSKHAESKNAAIFLEQSIVKNI